MLLSPNTAAAPKHIPGPNFFMTTRLALLVTATAEPDTISASALEKLSDEYISSPFENFTAGESEDMTFSFSSALNPSNRNRLSYTDIKPLLKCLK